MTRSRLRRVSASIAAIALTVAGLTLPAAYASGDEPDHSGQQTPGGQQKRPADLGIDLTANRAKVSPGDQLRYAVKIVNRGRTAANRAQARIQLADGLTYQSARAPKGWTCTNRAEAVSCSTTHKQLASGDAAALTIITVVDKSAKPGTLRSTANVTSASADTNRTNDTKVSRVSVPKAASTQADLSVALKPDGDKVAPGAEFNYQLVVKNAGPDDLDGSVYDASASVDIPDGISFVNADGVPDGWKCDLLSDSSGPYVSCVLNGVIKAGESVTLPIRAKVNQDTKEGTITNTGTAGPDNPDDTWDTNLGDNVDDGKIVVAKSQPAKPQADLSMSLTPDGDKVAPGDEFTYTATVKNAGPADADSSKYFVADSVDLEDGVTFVNADGAPKGWKCSAQSDDTGRYVECDQLSGAIKAGGTVKLPIKVKVAKDAKDGPINNRAEIYVDESTGLTDPNTSNNTDKGQVVVAKPTPAPAKADVRVALTPDGDKVAPGDEFTYTLTAKNAGPADVDASQGVDGFVDLANGVTFVSADAPDGWKCSQQSDDTGKFVGCQLVTGTIKSGATVKLAIKATVNADAKEGSIKNLGQVGPHSQDNVWDPDLDNNTDAGEIAVAKPAPTPSKADLTVTAGPDGRTVHPGDSFTDNVTVKNSGPATATGVVVTIPIPDGLNLAETKSATRSVRAAVPDGWTCPAAEGSNVVCQTDSLAAGQTANIAIGLKVASDARPGTRSSAVKVSSDTTDPAKANNSDRASVVVAPAGVADVALALDASPNTVRVGDKVTYTLTVGNVGTAVAKDVVVTENWPKEVKYLNHGKGDYAPSKGQWTVGTLQPGGSAKLTITGKITSAAHGKVVNTARATTTSKESRSDNNADLVTYKFPAHGGNNPPPAGGRPGDHQPPLPNTGSGWTLIPIGAGGVLVLLAGSGLLIRSRRRATR